MRCEATIASEPYLDITTPAGAVPATAPHKHASDPRSAAAVGSTATRALARA